MRVPDTTAPRVLFVAMTSDPGTDRTYAADEEIELTLTFDEAVTVRGAPQLKLEVGDEDRMAGYVGGSGTDALVFGYKVTDGESDSGGSERAGRQHRPEPGGDRRRLEQSGGVDPRSREPAVRPSGGRSPAGPGRHRRRRHKRFDPDVDLRRAARRRLDASRERLHGEGVATAREWSPTCWSAAAP